MDDLMILVENVSKQYKLGQIGGTTLRDELQRKAAKRKGKEDPTQKIGSPKYTYGETFMALDGITFEVKRGERIGIIGHNGAGKSTLLKLLSRITAPTGGKISLNGRVASMLEVGTGFHGELTGRENIYMNGAILGMTKKEIDEKIENIIDFSECRQFIDTPVKRYSSGMYVKLAFSVAAHLNSEIMIMDEVLAVGDMTFQKKCIDKMNQVSREDNRTVLYVSHNMATIRQLCERCIVLDHGHIVYEGDVEESINRYLNINEVSCETNIDLTQCVHELAQRKNIHMTRLEILGKNKLSYYKTEKLRFKLTYHTDSPNQGVSFRVLIRNAQGDPVGMSHSRLMDLDQTANQEMLVEFDLSMLRDGKYYVSIGFFYMETTNVPQGIDSISRVFAFELVPDPCAALQYEWRSKIFGSVEFPEIHVQNLN